MNSGTSRETVRRVGTAPSSGRSHHFASTKFSKLPPTVIIINKIHWNTVMHIKIHNIIKLHHYYFLLFHEPLSFVQFDSSELHCSRELYCSREYSGNSIRYYSAAYNIHCYSNISVIYSVSLTTNNDGQYYRVHQVGRVR